MNNWQLQEAQERLEEVIDRAATDGPQLILRNGVQAAVVISAAEYHRLSRREPDLVEFFRSSPLMDIELDLTRDPDPGRF